MASDLDTEWSFNARHGAVDVWIDDGEGVVLTTLTYAQAVKLGQDLQKAIAAAGASQPLPPGVERIRRNVEPNN